MKKSEITDDTKMWFGQYRGRRFEDIPASYFLNYLDGRCEARIQKYIDDNRDVLEKEMMESRPTFYNH